MAAHAPQRLATIALALACAAYLLVLGATSSLLPERVASHFGMNGQADDWMSRSTYLLVMAGIGLGMVALFQSIGWIMRHTPASAINLPNREYWLAPERRDETCTILSNQFTWFGVGQLGFFLLLHLLVIDANRRDPQQLSNLVWGLLVLFLLAVATWVTLMTRRFKQLPATGN